MHVSLSHDRPMQEIHQLRRLFFCARTRRSAASEPP
jgi:hypothetical protein